MGSGWELKHIPVHAHTDTRARPLNPGDGGCPFKCYTSYTWLYPRSFLKMIPSLAGSHNHGYRYHSVPVLLQQHPEQSVKPVQSEFDQTHEIC